MSGTSTGAPASTRAHLLDAGPSCGFRFSACGPAICRITGQDHIRALVHCQGSTSFMIALAAGLCPSVARAVQRGLAASRCIADRTAQGALCSPQPRSLPAIPEPPVGHIGAAGIAPPIRLLCPVHSPRMPTIPSANVVLHLRFGLSDAMATRESQRRRARVAEGGIRRGTDDLLPADVTIHPRRASRLHRRFQGTPGLGRRRGAAHRGADRVGRRQAQRMLASREPGPRLRLSRPARTGPAWSVPAVRLRAS